jgi:hypothetical protein
LGRVEHVQTRLYPLFRQRRIRLWRKLPLTKGEDYFGNSLLPHRLPTGVVSKPILSIDLKVIALRKILAQRPGIYGGSRRL